MTAFAVEGDLDVDAIVSNTFEIEWPPKGGKMLSFPEIDRAAARRAERKRGILLAWLHLRAAGGTVAHGVVVGRDAPDFKRVARDNGRAKD